jgi:hypothetical protein
MNPSQRRAGDSTRPQPQTSILQRVSLAVLLPIAALAVALLLVRPFGGVFYGGDDWAYAWSVRNLIDTGHFVASPWVTATAMPQTLWSAAFATAFGASPAVFNVATLVASAIGLGCLYVSARTLGCSSWSAALTAALVGVTPQYLAFACSFMSDMHYTALMLGAVACYLTALDRGSVLVSIAGGLLAALAFLERQVGLSLPLAFAVGVWFSRQQSLRPMGRLKLLLAGGFLPFSFVVASRLAPEFFGGQTLAQRINTDPERLLNRMLDLKRTALNLQLAHVYLATLLLPLFLVLAWRARGALTVVLRRRAPWLAALGGACLALASVRFVLSGGLLARGEFLHAEHYGAELLPLERWIWAVLNPPALLASVALAVLIFERFRVGRGAKRGDIEGDRVADRESLAKTAFLITCLACHVGLTVSFVAFHNNYFLPFLPLGALLAAQALGSNTAAPGAAELSILVVSLLLGSLVVERQFRFVEAVESARQRLIERGAVPSEVFGHPSSYATTHTGLVIADLTAHRNEGSEAFSVFHRIRERSRFWIGNQSLDPDPKLWRPIDQLRYPTLLGDEALVIWEHRSPAPP